MKRNRVRFIYWAFALSLLVHISLAPLAPHFRAVPADKDPDTFRLETAHPRATMPPTPPPTPHVKREPPRITSHTVAVHTPVITTHPAAGDVHRPPGDKPMLPPPGGGTTGTNAIGTSAPPASAAPSPSPKPVCSAPFLDAQTVKKYIPEMPQIARDQGLSGTAQVKVDLSAAGIVTDARIFQSTGSSALDNAAVDAAKRTTYSPKVVNCEQVPGSYLFRVEFSDG